MGNQERRFAFTISGAHGIDHLLNRVFPPLLPIWALAFGLPLWKLGIILGARSFGSALGQAPMGHLSDRFDRRFMLPAGIALKGIGFLILASLTGLELLEFEFVVNGMTISGLFAGMLVTMLLIGIGSSTVHPTGYPLISQNVSSGTKGKVLGMWGSARAFGDGGAPALVGLALLLISWQGIIVGFGILGLVFSVYLFIALGSFDTRPVEQDTTEAEKADSPSIWEADRRLYLYPMLAVFVAFVMQLMATVGVTVFLPQFITSQYGFTLSVAGFTITPESTASFYYSALLLTAGVVQIGTGELIDRHDHRLVLIGFLITAALILALISTLVFSPLQLFVILLLLGGTLWGLNPARDAIISDIAPPELEGRTFGYLWTGGLLIASASPAIVGFIGDVAGLRRAFLVIAGIILLSAIPISLLLSERTYIDSKTSDTVEAN